MTRNLLETVLGAIVLIVAVVFVVYAYGASQVGSGSGYELKARFDRIDGLQRGSDVRIGGIKVGTVVEQMGCTRVAQHVGRDVALDAPAEIVARQPRNPGGLHPQAGERDSRVGLRAAYMHID